jgi:spore coat protein U-like protein
MTQSRRVIVRLVAFALLGAASTTHVQAATTTVQASVKVVKSLTLTSKQNLDFGTILLSGSPSPSTVSISGSGAISCGSGLTCSGAVTPAIFNVQGSNAQTVQIFAVQSDLTNAVDGSKLRFTPTAPDSITLTNSGAPGKDFNVGGSIAIPSNASEGVYTGNVEVTVDYQ